MPFSRLAPGPAGVLHGVVVILARVVLVTQLLDCTAAGKKSNLNPRSLQPPFPPCWQLLFDLLPIREAARTPLLVREPRLPAEVRGASQTNSRHDRHIDGQGYYILRSYKEHLSCYRA